MDTGNSHVWHPFTRFSSMMEAPLPMITRGEGIYLYDDRGNRYVDAISSWWCINLGHGHPRLVRAIQKQAPILQQSILGHLNNSWADELASALCRTMPTPERHVMFASDGSCAVDAALKMAVQYFHNRGKKRKSRFLALEQGYHGDTVGAVSVGFVPGFHDPFEGLVRREYTVPLPDYEDGDGIRPTREMIERHGDELAAVIVEPLCQGAAGMRMYPPEYLRDLASLCSRHDILLIVDEIAMGFGRTGTYWAFEQAQIDPDIVCLGKGITGGYLPLSAAICKDHIYETFTDKGDHDNTFYHGHTFTGNPLAAACALEALRVYRDMNAPEHVRALGNVLHKQISRMQDNPKIKNIRQLGLIGVVELYPAENSPARAAAIRAHLREKGVLLRPLGDVFYLFPPFVIDEAQLLELCTTFMDAIDHLA